MTVELLVVKSIAGCSGTGCSGTGCSGTGCLSDGCSITTLSQTSRNDDYTPELMLSTESDISSKAKFITGYRGEGPEIPAGIMLTCARYLFFVYFIAMFSYPLSLYGTGLLLDAPMLLTHSTAPPCWCGPT